MARGPIGRERLARLPRCDLGLGQEGRVGLFQIDPVFVRIRAHACRPPPKLPTPLLHRAPWISRLAVTKFPPTVPRHYPMSIVGESQRDVRLDIFRGLALWLIFLDHI